MCDYKFGDRCDIAGELCIETRGDQCSLRCPHIEGKQAGDESLDFCDINDKVCLLVTNNECPEWEEIQREWRTGKEEADLDNYWELNNASMSIL